MPSPLVVALLRFVASENEALAGDLAEELVAGKSRRWFRSQLRRAVFVVAVRKCRAGLSSQAVRTLGVVAMAAAVAVLGVWSVTLVRHAYIEGVVLLSLSGGVLIALLRFRHAAKRSDLPVTLDPFARTAFSVDTLNISHIRVAGLGGAGLVLTAAGVALQYPLTTAALTLGLLGGMAGAAWESFSFASSRRRSVRSPRNVRSPLRVVAGVRTTRRRTARVRSSRRAPTAESRTAMHGCTDAPGHRTPVEPSPTRRCDRGTSRRRDCRPDAPGASRVQ